MTRITKSDRRSQRQKHGQRSKDARKNIRRMSESYLDQTNETVQAKRGRNV